MTIGNYFIPILVEEGRINLTFKLLPPFLFLIKVELCRFQSFNPFCPLTLVDGVCVNQLVTQGYSSVEVLSLLSHLVLLNEVCNTLFMRLLLLFYLKDSFLCVLVLVVNSLYLLEFIECLFVVLLRQEHISTSKIFINQG